MKVVIDTAGRIVVPKTVRDDLGLSAGSELDLRVVDRRIELDAPATSMRLVEHRRGVVAVADRDMPTLTSEVVRDTLERVRR